MVLIDLGNQPSIKVKYSIYDVRGAIVKRGKIETSIKSVDVSELVNGSYIITVDDKDGQRMASNNLVVN